MGDFRVKQSLLNPVVAAVVVTVKKEDMKPPKRVSMPRATNGRAGMNAKTKLSPNRIYAPHKSGLDSRFLPIISPKTKINAVGSRSINEIIKMFEIGEGFMNG